MMKFTLPKNSLLILSFLVISFACQEDAINEVHVQDIDEDMIKAKQLVDNYLKSSNSKANTGGEISSVTTVLRYENGVLLYDTEGDTIDGYQPINEETVTAAIEPGDNVFWYAGSGLSALNGIDFDSTSTAYLGEDPEEAEAELLWLVVSPTYYDSTTNTLKYDIIYDFEGNTGEPIRLDPKILVYKSIAD